MNIYLNKKKEYKFTKHLIFNFFIIFNILVFLYSCEKQNEKNHSPENQPRVIEIHTFDTTLLSDAKELNSNVKIKITTDFDIVYFSNQSNKIFIKIPKSKELYYTNCIIDSSFYFNLLKQSNDEIIFRGTFSLPSINNIQFTFFAINIYNKEKGTYQNLFNDYFLLDKSSILKFDVVNDFVYNWYNALICSYKEGSGDFLEFKIYGFRKNKFDLLYEPMAPLENGYFLSDSSGIYLLSNYKATKLNWLGDSIKVENLNETPLLNFKEGDQVLRIEELNDGIKAPKFLILSENSVLHISVKDFKEDIKINFDDAFWTRNFNQLIPKKQGLTRIWITDSFKQILKQIKIIIN